MNRIIRYIPGAAGVSAQLGVWQEQLAELRPLYPIVLPILAWVFVRSYNSERERLRLERLTPILRPEKRLPEKRSKDA